MKTLLSYTLLFGSLSAMANAPVDWSQPKVACMEDIMPKGFPCLDLSEVKNPLVDFPSDMDAAEKKLWQSERSADLTACRSEEVVRRAKAGSTAFTGPQVQISWMKASGAKDIELKRTSIYQAARENDMPPYVLFGALSQESLLSNLSISPDGDNYSCGMAQINIQEFCRGISALSSAEKANLGWPEVKCDSATIPTTILKPFFEVAAKKLNGRPEYQMEKADFDGITLEQVIAGMPAGNPELTQKRFQAVKSFINLCHEIKWSIKFKAKELRSLYNLTPTGLRNIERYQGGDTFHSTCEEAYTSSTYPLQTAWLLAVAMYNAGPNQIKVLQHYYKMTKESSASTAWNEFNPLSLIEGLHWGGKYKEGTTSIFYKDLDGKEISQRWFKSCVVQRHVARVIQHVTMKGETLALSAEKEGCIKDVVPEYRKASSGFKED